MNLGGGVQGQHRVSVGATGAQLGRHPDRLHELGLGGALAHRGFGVSSDAVRALGDVRDRDSDQLLVLLVERAGGEDLATERLERIVGRRRELLATRFSRPTSAAGLMPQPRKG